MVFLGHARPLNKHCSYDSRVNSWLGTTELVTVGRTVLAVDSSTVHQCNHKLSFLREFSDDFAIALNWYEAMFGSCLILPKNACPSSLGSSQDMLLFLPGKFNWCIPNTFSCSQSYCLLFRSRRCIPGHGSEPVVPWVCILLVTGQLRNRRLCVWFWARLTVDFGFGFSSTLVIWYFYFLKFFNEKCFNMLTL